MVKIPKYDNPYHKIKLKIRQIKYWVKVQGKLTTPAMNGASVANRCNHQVLRIE